MSQSGWGLRTPTTSDVGAMVGVINAQSRSFGHGDTFSADEFADIVSAPSIELARDGRLLVDGERAVDGQSGVVGVVMAPVREPYTTAHVYVSMVEHPRREEGLRLLLDAGLGIAASRTELGSDAVVESEAVAEADHQSRKVLEDAGFREVRRTCVMARDLDDQVAALRPTLPEGVELGVVNPADERLLERLAALNREAFGDHDGDYGMSTADFVHFMTSRANLRVELSPIALVSGEPVGMTACLDDASDPSGQTGYIGILGVARRVRGQGVGRALLEECFRRFHDAGLRRARLHVQIGNRTGADRLYRSVGMEPGPVDLSFQRALRDPG